MTRLRTQGVQGCSQAASHGSTSSSSDPAEGCVPNHRPLQCGLPRFRTPEACGALPGSESSISQDGALSESASTSDPLQLEEYDAAGTTVYGLQPEDWSHAALSVVVVGASGALPTELLQTCHSGTL